MPVDAAGRLRRLAASGALDLPLPGAGATPARLEALRSLAAAEDLSVARLAEAHTDAVAILAEAGARRTGSRPARGVGVEPLRRPRRGRAPRRALAPPGHEGLLLGRIPPGRRPRHRHGRRRRAALPRATARRRRQRRAVDLAQPRPWPPPPPAPSTSISTCRPTPPSASPASTSSGAGLWHGAIGVAACWAGGADGLAATVRARIDPDDAQARARLGAIEAARWGMGAVLADCGRGHRRRPAGPGRRRVPAALGGAPPRRRALPQRARPHRPGPRPRPARLRRRPRPAGARPAPLPPAAPPGPRSRRHRAPPPPRRPLTGAQAEHGVRASGGMGFSSVLSLPTPGPPGTCARHGIEPNPATPKRPSIPQSDL